ILIGKLKTQRLDPLVFHAAEKIRLGQGGIRVKELMETLPISRDAFEKKFRRIVGTSPKQFSNIIRMRTLLEKGKGNKSLTDLAYEAGYFDQSHFIKDFKLFTGQTPSQFFKSPAFW
ncbi:MAG: helix-turn-helix domain-containing protein, partial [Bacteroidota bacterium]